MKKLTKKGNTPDDLGKSFLEHLKYSLGVSLKSSSSPDKYIALAQSIRDRIVERWFDTRKTHFEKQAKSVNYFSFEFLMGRALANNMINMGIQKEVEAMLADVGVSWEEITAAMVDSGLGNGGLGRLAACFLDSLATLEIPAFGYGLRYEYGYFKQVIVKGYQEEEADDWLKFPNPWEIHRNDIQVMVPFGGRVVKDKQGRSSWVDTNDVLAIPYDTPIVGYGGNTVNTLRLWSAQNPDRFDYQAFNEGDYYNSVDEDIHAETLTKILYPNDSIYSGKKLRFRQQFFFVSASLQDILRRFKEFNLPMNEFPEKMAVQLNDTHPAIAVAELMRLLVDIEELDWDSAWDITTRTFAYTNHTLMPEALETWPVSMFEEYLPRHLEIIYRINHFFLREVAGLYPGDMDKLSRLSLIGESGEKHVRMAALAILGSHSVNGVAELHSRLVKENLVPDFYRMFPERFNNKTNGITQRRWLLKANPELASLISDAIGEGWIKDLSLLKDLDRYKTDGAFLDKLARVKQDNKEKLAKHCRNQWGFDLNVDSLFDVQVKRIHEYKRQLLKVLHIIHLYNRIRAGEDIQPRTFLFSGKAAPGYYTAKQVIKLINSVADVINGDKMVKGRLQVHFLPNYSVSLAENIFPASELSEQISTAGTEASGTGNMKFMLNGALTIGTLDGANIEILEEVGEDNMFIFGLKTLEVDGVRQNQKLEDYLGDERIASVLNLLKSGYFNISEPGIFDSLIHILTENDHYLHLADLGSYMDVQDQVSAKYGDRQAWLACSLANIAHSGKFSSDRTIAEYARDIWDVKSCHVR